MKRFSTVLIALLSVSAFSQIKDRSEAEFEANAAVRVASLVKRFGELLEPTAVEQQWREACMKNCAQAGHQVKEDSARAGAERVKAMNAVASQIHREIDAYIVRAVHPSHVDPAEVTKRLRRILGSAADETPSAFVIDGDDAPSLIVAYNLLKGGLMGEGGTSVTLRAYTATQGAFRLVAATGEDMDGYAGISFVKLHSPVPHELWLLLSGQFTGANGPNTRMRLYAYGRAKFTMVWAPENAWGAFTVRVADRGFTVDGDYYREAKARHDVYFVAEDGVYRVSPRTPAAQ